jgi:hypothetical protein
MADYSDPVRWLNADILRRSLVMDADWVPHKAR